MRAPCLFLAFALAKAAALAGHPLPHSWWTPAAYLGQDAMIALAFAVFEKVAERFAWQRVSTTLFWLLTAYAALNIPVMRAVGTPLTIPMLRAAGGPLADSFALYATLLNAGLVLGVLGVTAASLRWISPASPKTALLILVLIAALGPLASARVDTAGLGRNVLAAIAADAVPDVFTHIRSRESEKDWRASRFESAAVEDLSRLRGLGRGRNIVMVSLESTAAQYLRLYGGDYDLMPNLDELAHNAVVFDNAYAVYPESIKGLYSVLCSADPAMDTQPETYEKSPCRSIPQALSEAGYRTALFHSGRFDYLGMESVVRHRGYEVLEDAGDIGGNRQSSFGVDEPATVARMLAWIDGLPRDRPFFLTYLPIAGHHPYNTPEKGPFPEHDEIGRYRNALRYGDAALGTLRAGLRARGLDNNTLWVIYGDHGEAFGQHEGNYAHTFFVYEENVHVPFLIAAPGSITSQQRVHKVVSLLDTAPTLLDLTGLSIPKLYQGRSMLNPEPRMALFFTDYSLKLRGVRDGPWKMIYEQGRAPKLFNVETDPGERRDLAAETPQRAAWYRSVATGWMP